MRVDHFWKAELAFPTGFTKGNLQTSEAFDEHAWELYNLNDDPTARIALAKK